MTEGLYTMWYKDGNKFSEGYYKNDKYEGLWTWWYNNGQKSSEGTFKNGQIIFSKNWNKDGSIKKMSTYD